MAHDQHRFFFSLSLFGPPAFWRFCHLISSCIIPQVFYLVFYSNYELADTLLAPVFSLIWRGSLMWGYSYSSESKLGLNMYHRPCVLHFVHLIT